MNDPTNQFHVEERLGALLDGESDNPGADLQWLETDPVARERYRQYEAVRALMRALPEPDMTQDLGHRVLRQIERRKRNRRGWTYALAASGIFVLGVLLFHLMPLPAPDPVAVSPAVVPSGEAPEETLYPAYEEDAWLLMVDALAGFGLSPSLNTLNGLSEELLLLLLAELAFPPESEATNGSLFYHEPSLCGPPAFTDLFYFVDMLNEADAYALNQVLHAALDEA